LDIDWKVGTRVLAIKERKQTLLSNTGFAFKTEQF